MIPCLVVIITSGDISLTRGGLEYIRTMRHLSAQSVVLGERPWKMMMMMMMMLVIIVQKMFQSCMNNQKFICGHAYNSSRKSWWSLENNLSMLKKKNTKIRMKPERPSYVSNAFRAICHRIRTPKKFGQCLLGKILSRKPWRLWMGRFKECFCFVDQQAAIDIHWNQQRSYWQMSF